MPSPHSSVEPFWKSSSPIPMDTAPRRHLLLLLPLLSAAAAFVSATDHIVGGHLGWNPKINYSSWANNQTFYVGDLISFRYQKNMFNVFEVNRTGYDNCTMDGLAGNWSSGKDFIPLNLARAYYFIGGNGYCLSGMKVSITVHPLNSNSSSSPAAAHETSHPQGAAGFAASRGPSTASALLAVAFAAAASVWMEIGSGAGI